MEPETSFPQDNKKGRVNSTKIADKWILRRINYVQFILILYKYLRRIFCGLLISTLLYNYGLCCFLNFCPNDLFMFQQWPYLTMLTCFFDAVLLQVAWLIYSNQYPHNVWKYPYLGVMDEVTGTPLLEMKSFNGEKSINNPNLKSKKSMIISPLIR